MTSSLPADVVFGAMVDFSPRRVRIWPALSERFYEVHQLGETSAVVTEGSDVLGGMWVRERYDWSVDNKRCRSVVIESPRVERSTTW